MLVIIKYTHSRYCCCCCGCGNCCSCVNPYNVTKCSFFSSFFISFFSVFVVVMLFSACHCHFAFISISLNISTRIKCVITIPLLVANNIVFFFSLVFHCILCSLCSQVLPHSSTRITFLPFFDANKLNLLARVCAYVRNKENFLYITFFSQNIVQIKQGIFT